MDKITELQIVERETGNVVESFDVAGYTARAVDKLAAGIDINLDHQRFYTRRI